MKRMYYFCTYFDTHFMQRGLALYESLKRHCAMFKLWILCMDRTSYETLARLNLPGIELIALEAFEKGDDALLNAKQNRTRIEYYFTCTPSLPLFILNHWPEVDTITYLDADLFFFADPAPIYREFSGHSIAIIPHRFPPELRDHERHGIYNVGYLSFKRNQQAVACLRWWQEKCLEWCFDRVENNRYADQKYLDDWPARFSGVVEIRHKGANVAPWNLSNYTIRQNSYGRQSSHGRKSSNGVHVDDDPLIFFHFHGFHQIAAWLYDPNLASYKVKLSRTIKQSIVKPYIHALAEAARLISPYVAKPTISHGIRGRSGSRSGLHRIRKTLEDLVRLTRTILTKNYVVVINGRIL